MLMQSIAFLVCLLLVGAVLLVVRRRSKPESVWYVGVLVAGFLFWFGFRIFVVGWPGYSWYTTASMVLVAFLVIASARSSHSSLDSSVYNFLGVVGIGFTFLFGAGWLEESANSALFSNQRTVFVLRCVSAAFLIVGICWARGVMRKMGGQLRTAEEE